MERDADTETIGLATFGEVAHSVYRQEILCNSLCNTIMIRGWQGNLSSRYYQAFKNGGERGIRTLDTGFPVYSLSRRAPSTYSAISPYVQQSVRNSGFITYHAQNNKSSPKKTGLKIHPLVTCPHPHLLIIFQL